MLTIHQITRFPNAFILSAVYTGSAALIKLARYLRGQDRVTYCRTVTKLLCSVITVLLQAHGLENLFTPLF
jgi:hypothetical protein